METQINVTSRHIELSENAMDFIIDKVKGLEHYCRGALSCQVVVDVPHKRHKHGRDYKVKIYVASFLEGDVAARDFIATSQHEDLFVAVTKAAKTLKRELRKSQRRGGENWSHQHGKTYRETLRGRVPPPVEPPYFGSFQYAMESGV